MYTLVLCMAMGSNPAMPTGHRDIGYHNSDWSGESAVRPEAHRHRRGGGCNGCNGGGCYGGCYGGYGCSGGYGSRSGCYGCSGGYSCYGGCYGGRVSGYRSYYAEGGSPYNQLPPPTEKRRASRIEENGRGEQELDQDSSLDQPTKGQSDARPTDIEKIPAPTPVGAAAEIQVPVRTQPRERFRLLAAFRSRR